jgi:endonuclease-8
MLGDDPLRSDADPERVWARVQKSKKPIGQLLLDQSIVAGIGNIYRAEILFLMKIHPSRPSNSLTRDEFDDLWKTSVRLLAIGVKYNRIITVDREETDKPLSRLSTDERLLIYKKDQCPHCNSKTEKWLLGNMQMFACSVCQV